MGDELVALVNDRDEIVGKALKSDCHRHGLFHRGASILLFRDSSYREILVQKRSEEKSACPGKYCFPGGHVGLEESYEEAALRELQEELFQNAPFSDVKLEPLFKIRKYGDGDYEFVQVFRCVSPGPFSLDPQEVESVQFIDVCLLEQKMGNEYEDYTQTACEIFRDFRKRYPV